MTEAHYGLNADPADNPHQPPREVQAISHPGARMHAVRMQSQRAGLQAQTAQAYGDVYLDYSQARPANSQLLSVPRLVGVCRYESPLNPDGSYYAPTAAKMITPAEGANLVNVLQLDLKHNYEWYETRMDEGAPAGRQDANWAATLAYRVDTAIGRSTVGRHIIYSNDKSGTPYETVVAYLVAAQTRHEEMPGGYLAGYYGPQSIVARLAADPRIWWPILLWQTCAWSGGVYGGTGHLYQAICAPVSPNLPGCDTNFRMKPDPTGDDVPTPLTDDDVKKIWSYVLNGVSAGTRLTSADQTSATVSERQTNVFMDTGKGHPYSLPNLKAQLDGLGSALANLDVAKLTASLTKAVQDALAAGVDPKVLTQAFQDAFGASGLAVELSGTAKPPTPQAKP